MLWVFTSDNQKMFCYMCICVCVYMPVYLDFTHTNTYTHTRTHSPIITNGLKISTNTTHHFYRIYPIIQISDCLLYAPIFLQQGFRIQTPDMILRQEVGGKSTKPVLAVILRLEAEQILCLDFVLFVVICERLCDHLLCREYRLYYIRK